MRNRFRPALAGLAIAAVLAAAPAGAEDTLYKKLGGYDAIAAVTDAFLDKAAKDADLGRFFVGHNSDNLKIVRQHIVDFICAKAGGPCLYTGREMAPAHAGLKITEKDWDASNRIFGEVMDGLAVPAALQKDVAAFVGTLEGDIVGK